MLLSLEGTEKEGEIRRPFLIGLEDMPGGILEIDSPTGEKTMGLENGCVIIDDISGRDLTEVKLIEDARLDLVKHPRGTAG